jgi:hypothetical protein
MTPEDIRKLLGGYATDTLSEEEKKALYEAALHDDELFKAMADEHALREMLADPRARASVLRAVDPPVSAWRWAIPIGIAASLVIVSSVVFVFNRPHQAVLQESAMPAAQRMVQPALQPELPAKAPAPPPSTSVARKLAPAPARRPEKQESRAVTGGIAGGAPAGEAGLSDAAGTLQYTILKRGADGKFNPVDPASTFTPTDSVRLNVEANQPGFLEVSQKEPPKLLFGGQIQKQVPIVVPSTGSIPLDNTNLRTVHLLFVQQSFASGFQNSLTPQLMRSASKQKTASEVDAESAGARNPSRDEAASQAGQTPRTITVDVNLKVATPPRQE